LLSSQLKSTQFQRHNNPPFFCRLQQKIRKNTTIQSRNVIGYGLPSRSAHGDFDKTKELLDKLLPALTGLIGSALGFYFGSKSSNGWTPNPIQVR
jgi:hypothetical protein